MPCGVTRRGRSGVCCGDAKRGDTGDDEADDGANAGARGDSAPSSLSSTAICATLSSATHNSPELMRGMGMGALVARCVKGTCSHEGLTVRSGVLGCSGGGGQAKLSGETCGAAMGQSSLPRCLNSFSPCAYVHASPREQLPYCSNSPQRRVRQASGSRDWAPRCSLFIEKGELGGSARLWLRRRARVSWLGMFSMYYVQAGISVCAR